MELCAEAVPPKNLQFLLSLLRIANPGQPPSDQTRSLEKLFDAKTAR
ncbi:MAG TPA: hypothetical protein VKX39_10920 [Bryobacteraceae bacterium]|jgi:hypothetical protein|nr:hypothetical protein [Bryobacteraceae bacterium]